MTSVPLENRDLVRLRTDRNGMPWLVADHPLPATPEWEPLVARG
jgi:hypothetical protein